jgi:steroid 5-alpha reductase family enzyme
VSRITFSMSTIRSAENMTLLQLLLLNASLIAAAMILLWLLSLWLQDASIVDIFWGLGFVMVALVTFAVTDRGPRAVALSALTTLWGLRLAAYLAWRNHGKGEDPRYAAMRAHRGESFWWFSFVSVFSLQGAVMWLISLPIQVGQIDESPLGVLSFAGLVFWTIGFLFESIGDYQLARFKSDPVNDGKVMDRGLWRYTRHPNYFGNAMIWWGLFLVAVSTSTIWLVVSPLLMTFLLLKVSGVALLKRSLKSRSPQYCDYVDRTSPFVPWAPRRANENAK